MALLKDPELLILDEPSNGLDPIGQVEMQRLITQLGQGGRSILLSSHDMREVEELCGRVAVIGGGRLLFEGTPGELRGQARLWLRAEPAERAAEVLAGLSGLEGAERTGELLSLALTEDGMNTGGLNTGGLNTGGLNTGGLNTGGLNTGGRGGRQAAAVNRELVQAGLQVSEVRTERRALRGRVPGTDRRPHRRRGLAAPASQAPAP